jgi:CdiI N-terminal domain
MFPSRTTLRSDVFAIELRSPQEAGRENGTSAEASGIIVIGDFTETFRAPLGFWEPSDYRNSCRRAFEVLDADPRSASCPMTSMTDPRNSNFLVSWPMYREGECVYIQNALIFLDEIAGVFDPAAPWGCVRPRSGTDEDGNKISEWVTSMDALRGFFR